MLVLLSNFVFTWMVHLLLHTLCIVDLLLSSHEIRLSNIMREMGSLSEVMTIIKVVVVHVTEIGTVLRGTWLASA